VRRTGQRAKEKPKPTNQAQGSRPRRKGGVGAPVRAWIVTRKPRKPGRLGKMPATSAREGGQADAVAVGVFAAGMVEAEDVEPAAADDNIVGDHAAADGAEERAVTDEARENVAGGIGDEFPRHHHDPDDAGEGGFDADRDFFGARWAKSWAGETTLAGETTWAAMFVARVAMQRASRATTRRTEF
jgi:hypothetical protein